VSNWKVLSSAWGQMKNELRPYGLQLRDRLIWSTLSWVCTTGHLTRRRKLMRLLQAAESSLTVTGPGSHGGLQLP